MQHWDTSNVVKGFWKLYLDFKTLPDFDTGMDIHNYQPLQVH